MNSKQLALYIVVGSICISLCAAMDSSGIGSSPNVGSNLSSAGIGSRPMLDIASLQKLVDDASDGSSVTITDDYASSVPLRVDKNITLVGAPFAYLDGQGTSQILKIDNPKASVTLENILVMHGKGDYGGAIVSQAKSLTIKDCRFLDSLADYGAAIYQKGGNLQVRDSTFEGNNATIMGAAIYDVGGDMQLRSSKFTQNSGSRIIYANGAQQYQAKILIKDVDVSDNPGPYNNLNTGFGGAIVCDNSTTQISHCTIKGNKALVVTSDFLGGNNAGLDFGGSDATISDTLIDGNIARFAPAVNIARGCKVAINHCNITGNQALSAKYHGKQVDGDIAGIGIAVGSQVAMDDVSIGDNQAEGECAAISNSGILSLKNVRIYGNTAGNISAIRTSKHGKLIFGKNVQIYGNNAPKDVYSEGPVEMDFD